MSNILTIGASPYLNVRNGRINRDLCVSLPTYGHKVDSLVWHHDIKYFLPSEINKHFFILNGKKICDLYPFLGQQGELCKFTYDTMKIVHPQIVITIGGYEETSFISNIKEMYPQLFKWIAIVTSPINEQYKEAMDYADHVITTNSSSFNEISNLLTTSVSHLAYGPDTDIFAPKWENEDFCVLNCGKNSQMSNVPAFMLALKASGVNGTLHTNLWDEGDYDLFLLMERYGIYETLTLPQKFVSVREGISQNSMNDLYNRHQVVVECSMQCPTALGLLEAMATGCIPIGANVGAVGDILSKMADEYRFVIPHEIFIGPREETYAIVSHDGIANAIKKLQSNFRNDKEWFNLARKEAISVSTVFSRDNFISSVNHTIDSIATSQHAIIVDSFD